MTDLVDVKKCNNIANILKIDVFAAGLAYCRVHSSFGNKLAQVTYDFSKMSSGPTKKNKFVIDKILMCKIIKSDL